MSAFRKKHRQKQKTNKQKTIGYPSSGLIGGGGVISNRLIHFLLQACWNSSNPGVGAIMEKALKYVGENEET